MTPTLLIVLTAIIGVLLVIAGSVGVWLAMRTGQHTQTVKNFRDAAASWREKAEALGSDLATMQGDLQALTGAHESLQAAHEALKNVITGKAAIEALGVQVEQAKTDIIFEVRLSREALEHLIGDRRDSLPPVSTVLHEHR